MERVSQKNVVYLMERVFLGIKIDSKNFGNKT